MQETPVLRFHDQKAFCHFHIVYTSSCHMFQKYASYFIRYRMKFLLLKNKFWAAKKTSWR